VSIAGRRVAARARGARVTVSLAGRSGTARVRLLARRRSGRAYRRTATLHLCVARRP